MEFSLDAVIPPKSVVPKVEYNILEATVTVKDNKLILSKEAAKALCVSANDRVAVHYWTVDKNNTFPVIGRADVFGSVDGNRVTKSNTVSFRGEQKEILLGYGSQFTIEPFKDYFKMVPFETKKDVFEEELAYLEELN